MDQEENPITEEPESTKNSEPGANGFKFKLVGVKILRYSLEGSRLIKKILHFIFFTIIWQTIKFVFLLIFWPVFIFLYRQVWKIINPISKRFRGAKSKLQLVFSNRYITHGLMIIIALAVIFNSYHVRNVNAEDFGQNNLIATLVLPEDDALIEEFYSPQVKKTAYLEEQSTTTVQSVVKLEDAESEELEEITTTTEGGATIVKPQISSTKISPRTREKVEYYIVQGGDTVSTIAEVFGVSTNTILWENNLGPRDFIKPGQKLTILPTSGVSHQVKNGDTLEKIANRYSVKQEEILNYNKLASADAISIDQVLIISGGTPPPPPPAPTTTSSGRSLWGTFTGPKPADAPAVASGMQWPAAGRRISQYFRYGHYGVDINGNTGDPIYAADDGRVVKVVDSGWGGGYGHHVVVNHGGGIRTLYAHTSANYVRVGDSVYKGQTIAAIGSTGRSTGPHLHFEVQVNGQKVNPLSYVR